MVNAVTENQLPMQSCWGGFGGEVDYDGDAVVAVSMTATGLYIGTSGAAVLRS